MKKKLLTKQPVSKLGPPTSDTIKQWHFTNKEAVNKSHFKNCLDEEVNLKEIEEKALETDYACITLMKTKIADLFPKMTTYLWKEHREKDLLQKNQRSTSGAKPQTRAEQSQQSSSNGSGYRTVSKRHPTLKHP